MKTEKLVWGGKEVHVVFHTMSLEGLKQTQVEMFIRQLIKEQRKQAWAGDIDLGNA